MIYIASDHAGFELKSKIIGHLAAFGFQVEDCGAFQKDPDDDYPDFVSKAAEAVSKDPENNKGIILGGSGQGEMMLANKYKGVRCGIFYAPAVPLAAADAAGRAITDPLEIIRLTREHNDANMISLGARFLSESDALKAVDVWLNTAFSGGRHQKRIEKIKLVEQDNFKQ